MYKLEIYKDLELIKTINFILVEALEMLQYKKAYELRGYRVQIWTLFEGGGNE